MNCGMNFDVWKAIIVFYVLATLVSGKPYTNNSNARGYSIAKRVEISNGNQYKKNQASIRRQNVIHAGSDYGDDKAESNSEPDELENLGKVIDYSGRVIDGNKANKLRWKDTAGISKDVIERIKEIQDSLIKRTGAKDLAEKLRLMQPEKNVTIASSGDVSVTSRKVIPEDVVNKIIEKFQELRNQAKTLAAFDEKAKAEGKEDTSQEVSDQDKTSQTSSEPERQEPTKQKVKQDEKKHHSSSPYESIGPPKDNEELRNITQATENVDQNKFPAEQEVFKAPSNGPAFPVNSQSRIMQPSEPDRMSGYQAPGNRQASFMPGNGNVPMMFIKQGEMLVPVFGGGGRQNQQFQRSVAYAPPAPQMMAPSPLLPKQPVIETGQSRSGPQTMNSMSEVPSVPISTIMSLMAPPNLGNLPASPMVPPQMNGGVYNVPQTDPMNSAGFMQQSQAGGFGNTPNIEANAYGRSMESQQQQNNFFQPEMQGLPGQPNENNPAAPFMPWQQPPNDPEQQQTAFMGGMPGQPSAMGAGGNSVTYGLSMDQSGRISAVNPMNPAIMPPQPVGPLNQNPFQEAHPEARDNFELMDKEKQMLNPNMVNPINDLSDPMEGSQQQMGMRNMNPDSLLELAKFRSTEASSSTPPMVPRNPDNLLDGLHMGQLSRDLAGPGDPDKFAVNGMMNQQQPSPFAGTNPESLLDMLSRRNSGDIANRNAMEMERATQQSIMENLKEENTALNRAHVTQIGTNGMQGASSFPPQGLDPSVADMIGNQAVDVTRKDSAMSNPVESSFFQSNGNRRGSYDENGNNKYLSVLSHDDLKFEHSKNSIDSGEGISPVNQADVYVRHRIMNPDIIGSKRSFSSKTLRNDNIELRVNGHSLAEKGSLRSKIVDGKVHEGKGKTLTSKSPVKIELSHADDAKKTKIINIVTTGKYKVADSKRSRVVKKDKLLKKFYTKT